MASRRHEASTAPSYGRGAPKGGAAKASSEPAADQRRSGARHRRPDRRRGPVPLAVAGDGAGGIPELAADTLVGLLRHRFSDLGPRSSDILSLRRCTRSARHARATMLDLLPVWATRVSGLGWLAWLRRIRCYAASCWFRGSNAAERNLCGPRHSNKIRPLCPGPVCETCGRAAVDVPPGAQAMRERWSSSCALREGRIGLGAKRPHWSGQVVIVPVWANLKPAKPERSSTPSRRRSAAFSIEPTDLGDVLSRAREYGVGRHDHRAVVGAVPDGAAGGSARTAPAPRSFSAPRRATPRRLADEFGAGVSNPTSSPGWRVRGHRGGVARRRRSAPFTFATEALGAGHSGRAGGSAAKRRLERFGVPQARRSSRH